jgi:formylglycine-generating enzyme required for sulfatase activity
MGGTTPSVPTLKDRFTQELPKHLVKFDMIKIPDGEIEVDGKKTEIKNLYFQETEMPFEVFEIFALRMDLPPEMQSKDAMTDSRPSKPYAVIFTNFGHHTYPAICMSYETAKLFCVWLSEQTGKKYRLPTTAEFEYAARAGEKGKPTNLDSIAWTWENADDTTHPVGTKKANAWGLKDMLGNAAEWATDPEGNPVVCGGSWKDKETTFDFGMKATPSPKWNESDPQTPKSKWWLANGQFVGLRVVCEMP